MKKNLIVTAIGLVLTIPAVATQKCIQWDWTDTQLESAQVEIAGPMWEIYIPETDQLFKGYGFMSETDGDVAEYISLSDTPSENIWCWCALSKPFHTLFIYFGQPMFSGPGECSQSCAYDFQHNADFREKIKDNWD